MVREVTSVQQSTTCFAGPAPHLSDKSSSSCRLSAPPPLGPFLRMVLVAKEKTLGF